MGVVYCGKGERMYRILVVEDELNIRKIIKDYLKRAGMDVVGAEDGEIALEYIQTQTFDLVLLDIMLPKISGWELCKIVKATKNIPVLFLTARGSEEDELKGLGMGADDYIIKPFKPAVLLARIQRFLDASDKSVREVLKYEDIEINLSTRKCIVCNNEIELTKLEFNILAYLVKNHDRVIERGEIIEKLWGYEYVDDDRIVDTQIKKLRKQLGAHAYLVRTVYGVGYIFEK